MSGTALYVHFFFFTPKQCCAAVSNDSLFHKKEVSADYKKEVSAHFCFFYAKTFSFEGTVNLWDGSPYTAVYSTTLRTEVADHSILT